MTSTESETSEAETSEAEEVETRTDDDGVVITVGPTKRSNRVPVADWGTLYRPDPKAVTEFLGADTHHDEPVPTSETAGGLPAQGFVPPSNHDGDNLVTDDRGLAQLKTQLEVQAGLVAGSPTQASAVSVAAEDMEYDPEEKAGSDIIPLRDSDPEKAQEQAQPESAQSPEAKPASGSAANSATTTGSEPAW